MHRFVNNHIVRGKYKNKSRPVLINSWESFYFKYNENRLLKLAGKARDIGIELFVLDDGWFGKRDSDDCSLGDWYCNTNKLPHGLSRLADKLKEKGMKFGIWVEPEMVSEVVTVTEIILNGQLRYLDILTQRDGIRCFSILLCRR